MSSSDKTRVLLADDEPHVRLTMKAVLTKAGMDVVGEAADGDEAVAQHRQHRPDLVLLDINMPFKTGEEALREIIAEFPDACVIMLTSVAEMRSINACLAAGASNYVPKDSSLEEILETIQDTLTLHREEGEGRHG